MATAVLTEPCRSRAARALVAFLDLSWIFAVRSMLQHMLRGGRMESFWLKYEEKKMKTQNISKLLQSKCCSRSCLVRPFEVSPRPGCEPPPGRSEVAKLILRPSPRRLKET